MLFFLLWAGVIRKASKSVLPLVDHPDGLCHLQLPSGQARILRGKGNELDSMAAAEEVFKGLNETPGGLRALVGLLVTPFSST